MSGDNKCKEINKSQSDTRTKEIRQGAVAYVEQHVEDFEGFLVTEVQVFSYDSKDDTVYMQTMACGILSKEETMEASLDRHRPQVSDFQDDDTLRFTYQQHQFHGATHYNCIISNKVCTRSLGA